MRTSKVAKRYAQGLLDFTQETNSTSAVFGEMKDVIKIMRESKELNSFFATPFIDSKKKIAAADEIFRNFSPVAKNIITLVIRQGRETEIKNIAQEFINKVEDLHGVQRVSLVTATSLSDQNVREILRSSGLVDANRQFDLNISVNPEILGGYILRVGDQQVDASVKTKLSRLRKNFQLS